MISELTVPEPTTSVVGQGDPPIIFDEIDPFGAVNEV